jgi:hypothetical protein
MKPMPTQVEAKPLTDKGTGQSAHLGPFLNEADGLAPFQEFGRGREARNAATENKIVVGGEGKFRVSGFRFQVSGFRFQVSGFRFQVSGFKFQVSSFK